MRKIKYYFILVLFFASTFSFAAIGHLKITLTKKPTRYSFPTQNQVAAARALLGLKAEIPGGAGVFKDIVQSSFAYGDQTQNEFVFIGSGGNDFSGVYLYKNGVIEKIADTETNIPKGTAYFEQFLETSYDIVQGATAFIGAGVFGQKGIYFFDGKTLSKIVDQQDLVPQREGKFLDFSDISLFRQMLVFRGADGQGSPGIYLYSTEGIYKIADVSDKVEGKDIDDLHVEPNSFGYNQLILRVDFKDGSTEDYLVTVNYVPY
jgi:hypothetical protein